MLYTQRSQLATQESVAIAGNQLAAGASTASAKQVWVLKDGSAVADTLVTLVNGATQAIKTQISGLGTHLLLVMPGQRVPGGGSGSGNGVLCGYFAVRRAVRMDPIEALRHE